MCTNKKHNSLSCRILDVSENSLRDLNFEYEPDTLEKLTLISRPHKGRENRFDCTCDNVDTFGELMGQLNHTANKDLSCKNKKTEVKIFEAFGTPGMALESTLEVRAPQKLTDNTHIGSIINCNICQIISLQLVYIIRFDCHVDPYFFRINARSHMTP